MNFWTGWELLTASLSVEVVTGRYVTALTCFKTLHILHHYKDYLSFQSDILASVSATLELVKCEHNTCVSTHFKLYIV